MVLAQTGEASQFPLPDFFVTMLLNLGGFDCEGDVNIGGDVGLPPLGVTPGTVVTLEGKAVISGDYCYPCNFTPNQNYFKANGLGTYQFLVIGPDMYALKQVQISFGPPVPEPGTWAFTILGLAGLAAGFATGEKRRNFRIVYTREARLSESTMYNIHREAYAIVSRRPIVGSAPRSCSPGKDYCVQSRPASSAGTLFW